MKICSLSIKYVIDPNGLLGGKLEYDPYVAYHASFGAYRVKEIDPLVRLKKPGFTPTNLGAKKGEESGPAISMSSEAMPWYRSSKPIEMELLNYDEMKGDDSIRFKMFSHTRFSGVDSIDKSEGSYRERQIESGYCDLELIDLFNYYHETIKDNKAPVPTEVTFEVNDFFVDQKIMDEKGRELLNKNRDPTHQQIEQVMALARPLTEKAAIRFIVTVRNFDEEVFKKSIFAIEGLTETHLHSMLPINNREKSHLFNASLFTKKNSARPHGMHFHSVLFNSTKSWRLWIHTMNGALGQYCEHFMGDEENGLQALYKPVDASVSNLQLPMYVSDVGKMPVYAYWCNDPFFREYASKEAFDRDMKLYGFTEKSENFFLLILLSALRRYELDEETLIKAVDEHFSPKNTNTRPTADFLRVEEAIGDIGTSVANSADYTADFRFLIKEKGLKHGHKNIGEERCCSKCGKELKNGEGALSFRVVQLDSWDRVIVNNTSSCDDCEGQDNTATTVLRSYSIGRPDLGMDWASPAMRAVKKLLKYSVVIDDGALVTSAFMDTNNKKIESKQEDLPLIGSEMDKNAQNDGHCFGILPSLTLVIELLDAGNISKETIAKMRRENTIGGTSREEEIFRTRDRNRQLLVLEPTGSIEARLLPIAETYGEEKCYDPENRLFKKKKAAFLFMKQLRPKLKEEIYKDSGVADLFVGEGMPHYLEKQVIQRRTSSFYNSIVHGSSIDLMRFDPALSQFAFCVNNRYGVRIGELIRNAPQSKLSLVCPYANYGEKWQKEVVPMVECMQNQMPIMKLGRYNDKEYAEDIYSRFLSPSLMSATFAFKSPGAYKSTENVNAQIKFEALLKQVTPLSSNLTIVRLFSRVWKLDQSKEKTELLLRFIRELPGLVDFAFYVEKYIPVCEPVVEILIVIDVNKVLSLPIDAK